MADRNDRSSSKQVLQHERWELLREIDEFTEKPLIVLSFVWLALLIWDLTRGLNPLLRTISNVIWVLFIVDFVIGIVIAPRKWAYLRTNWLTVVSLMLPALRIFRIFRVIRLFRLARAARSVSLIRVVTSLNRGMRAIRTTLGRRGIGYVVALTAIITFGGAAGMYAFESPGAVCLSENAALELEAAQQVCSGQAADQNTSGLTSYGEAVWWTAMIMTTLGSEYWPITAEGRILSFLLALYAFAIFGYITATIAGFFVGQDAAQSVSAPATTQAADATVLRDEIAALRSQIAALTAQLEGDRGVPRAQVGEQQPRT